MKNYKEKVRLFDRNKNPEMYDAIQTIGKELNELGWQGQVDHHASGAGTAYVYPMEITDRLIKCAEAFGTVFVNAYEIYQFYDKNPITAAQKALDAIKRGTIEDTKDPIGAYK